MSKLDEIWIEWLDLHRQMTEGRMQGVDREKVAGLFISVAPDDYDPRAIPSVLYVGKATDGEWYPSKTVEEARNYTTDELKNHRLSPFWSFASALSKRLAEANNNSIKPLQNIVWTNISKIGACSGNPSGKHLETQRELSLRTLNLEINEFRPTLIVFVTNDYEKEIIVKIANAPDEKDWSKERNDDWHRWRPAAVGMPAIFWTGHPQLKPTEEKERWLEKAASLAKR